MLQKTACELPRESSTRRGAFPITVIVSYGDSVRVASISVIIRFPSGVITTPRDSLSTLASVLDYRSVASHSSNERCDNPLRRNVSVLSSPLALCKLCARLCVHG